MLLVIEDVHLPHPGVGTALVHALDHGSHIRPAEEWTRLVGEFVQVNFKFTGTGFEARERDGDPTDVEITAGTDRSFGAIGTFAVKL